MNSRLKRLLVLLALVVATGLLLAQFVWRMAGADSGSEALPHGGAAFAAYLLTIGYAIYYRKYWATPRRVTGREWSPMARWMLTILVVGGLGVTLGVAFPNVTNTQLGQVFLQSATFGLVGLGLVLTVSRRRSETSESAGQPPPFATASLRVGAWQVYAFVGAALLFAPIYMVMKGFETYVDIPACERTCQKHGYTFESLVTGKSTYNCNCRAADQRRTFHERTHIGGGSGALSAVMDWVVRTGSVFCVMAAWLGSLFGLVRWVNARNPDGPLARAYRACVQFMLPSPSPSKDRPDTKPANDARRVRNRSRRRHRA